MCWTFEINDSSEIWVWSPVFKEQCTRLPQFYGLPRALDRSLRLYCVIGRLVILCDGGWDFPSGTAILSENRVRGLRIINNEIANCTHLYWLIRCRKLPHTTLRAYRSIHHECPLSCPTRLLDLNMIRMLSRCQNSQRVWHPWYHFWTFLGMWFVCCQYIRRILAFVYSYTAINIWQWHSDHLDKVNEMFVSQNADMFIQKKWSICCHRKRTAFVTCMRVHIFLTFFEIWFICCQRTGTDRWACWLACVHSYTAISLGWQWSYGPLDNTGDAIVSHNYCGALACSRMKDRVSLSNGASFIFSASDSLLACNVSAGHFLFKAIYIYIYQLFFI